MSMSNRGAAWFPQDGTSGAGMMMGQVTPPNFMAGSQAGAQGGYMTHSPAGMLTPGAWSVPEASTPMAHDPNGQAGADPNNAAAGGGAGAMDPAMLALLQQQQQSSCCDCCGRQSGAGCCPSQGQPMDPFCCTTPGAMMPSCVECIYTCMDYTFLLMIILFLLCVVGFALVVGLKDIDNIFAFFNVTDTPALELAIRPYVMWRNVTEANDSSNASSSGDGPVSTTTTTTGTPDSTTTTTTDAPDSTTTTTTTTTDAPLQAMMEGARFAQYLAAPSTDALQPTVTGIASLAHTVYRAAGDDRAWFDAPLFLNDNDNMSANCSNVTEEMFPENCTSRHLLGSFGVICMEGNLNANVMAVQLSHWNNAKGTLWFLAMVYTAIAIAYAVLIHRQRYPAVPFAPPALNPQQMQSMTQQQREQIMFMMMQQQQQQAACCGARGVEVYDTPLYEFMRIAWLFVGFTVFCWTCNLFVSFWAFSGFYKSQTTDFLHDFWKAYARKFTGSVVMVTIYLAWPVCNFFLELVIFIIGFLPWLAIRSCCKPGIDMYRPELPNSELPGWIRTDMFFTDFNDVKRLGFSRQAWIMLTGKSTPFFEGCSNPAADRDPTMKHLMDQLPTMQFANFMQQQQMMMGAQQQQQQQMMMMMGQMPGQAPGAHMLAGQEAGVPSHTTAVPVQDGGAAAAPPAASSEAAGKRHRRSSKSRERSRSRHPTSHADPQADAGAAAAVLQLDATSAAMPPIPDLENASKPRRHRSHSRSRVSGAPAAAGGGAEGESASRSRRHRGSSSRHRNAEDGGSRSKAHRSRSRERSKERKKKSSAQADLDALAEL